MPWRCFFSALVMLAAFLVGPRASALSAQDYKVVDYRIFVSLDDKKKQLKGRERLIWRNTSTDLDEYAKAAALMERLRVAAAASTKTWLSKAQLMLAWFGW